MMNQDKTFESGFFLQLLVNSENYITRKIQDVDLKKLEHAYNEIMDKIKTEKETEADTESETEKQEEPDVKVQLCVHNQVAVSHTISPIFPVSNVEKTLKMILKHYKNYKKVFSEEYLKMFCEDPVSLTV